MLPGLLTKSTSCCMSCNKINCLLHEYQLNRLIAAGVPRNPTSYCMTSQQLQQVAAQVANKRNKSNKLLHDLPTNATKAGAKSTNCCKSTKKCNKLLHDLPTTATSCCTSSRKGDTPTFISPTSRPGLAALGAP